MRLNELEIKIALDSEEIFQKVYFTCNQLLGKPSSQKKSPCKITKRNDKQDRTRISVCSR